MPAACSFAASTLVATPRGERPIGSLKVGDPVIAYNPTTGQSEAEPVQHVWLNHDHDLVDVGLHETVSSTSTAGEAPLRPVARRSACRARRRTPAATWTASGAPVCTAQRTAWKASRKYVPPPRGGTYLRQLGCDAGPLASLTSLEERLRIGSRFGCDLSASYHPVDSEFTSRWRLRLICRSV